MDIKNNHFCHSKFVSQVKKGTQKVSHHSVLLTDKYLTSAWINSTQN
jgi:hypothetical protein